MLAIVIPYYKYAFFESTLLSLQNQTNKAFTVYIGDDASSENPKNLLEKYKGKLAYQYKRFDSNLGGISLTQQWERCLEMVQGETWVMILGDDDTISDNFVEAFYKHIDEINQLKISVIRYASVVVNTKGEQVSKQYIHPNLETAVDFLKRKYKGGTRSSLSEYIFKKEVVNAIRFKNFPLAWSSDTLAVVEFSRGKNIYSINEAFMYFRLSDINITGQVDSLDKNEAWFKFYVYLLENYGKKYPVNLVNTLFERLEKVQCNNKKTPGRWLKLIVLYIRFSKYPRFLSLFSKIKRSIV
ncbi:glycosyltransferase family 2 protein [Tamlana sp. 2_MG-2023]|uniref:glycosyltransferase family 2 protein n=1 Tax=unclassified Tamlana TaxID=2614803 RepID=UPI0026E474D1|nr:MULTISPECIES: glycosyltransferase family 2 protein [unclassified Tamlana]MDO6758749.1 glycosyltransferase family 2 protein [Tamlana sp. 2_MG-2023]MDO6789448.1 glycosyltransferase family 2 protein [Tamlana sp. 1_MG-2023]